MLLFLVLLQTAYILLCNGSPFLEEWWQQWKYGPSKWILRRLFVFYFSQCCRTLLCLPIPAPSSLASYLLCWNGSTPRDLQQDPPFISLPLSLDPLDSYVSLWIQKNSRDEDGTMTFAKNLKSTFYLLQATVLAQCLTLQWTAGGIFWAHHVFWQIAHTVSVTCLKYSLDANVSIPL